MSQPDFPWAFGLRDSLARLGAAALDALAAAESARGITYEVWWVPTPLGASRYGRPLIGYCQRAGLTRTEAEADVAERERLVAFPDREDLYHHEVRRRLPDA